MIIALEHYIIKMKYMKNAGVTGLALVLFFSGCNRAALRIPGASTSFPGRVTHYVATTNYPYAIVVTTPVDHRSEHYGESVAGTKWKTVSTNPLWTADATKLIQDRLVNELTSSGLFAIITTNSTGSADFILKTEIDGFCSQVRGFLVDRAAGIVSLRITLEQNGKILVDRKFERVVTDADKEYTGSQTTFIEQAMNATLADSLHEVLKDIVKQLAAQAATWPSEAPQEK
jgi:hypothetical protein